MKIYLLSIAFLLVFLACQHKDIINPTSDIGQNSSVSFYFQKPAELNEIVVTAHALVTAPDIDSIFSELTVMPNYVEGTIDSIPAGIHRKFEIFTYDTDTNLTYYGHAYADVPAGQIITVQIILYPVNNTGTVIIVGTFAPFPPQQSKIVFYADYNGLNDIYIIDPDGNNLTNLTNSQFDDIRPILSPDRNTISFNRMINGISRPFLMDINGTNVYELNILPGTNVAKCDWSPDGQKITFNALINGDDEIFTYDFSTEQLNQITNNSNTDWAPTWSPTGDWIVYFSDEPGMYRIYKIHPDGSGKSLINNAHIMEEKHPRISPDGNKVAFYSRDSGGWDLFTINIDGSNLVRLTNTPTVNEMRPCWSPNGHKFLFIRNDGTTGGGIYIMNTDGTGIIQLMDTPYNEDFANWR